MARKFVQFGGIYASKCAVTDLCGIAFNQYRTALMAQLYCPGVVRCFPHDSNSIPLVYSSIKMGLVASSSVSPLRDI